MKHSKKARKASGKPLDLSKYPDGSVVPIEVVLGPDHVYGHYFGGRNHEHISNTKK
jgi:hypothetical protein